MGDVPRDRSGLITEAPGPQRLTSGRYWWAPASVVVAWLIAVATPLPIWIAVAYAVGNVLGTAVGLRLQIARLQEWGDARRDHRPLLRWLCLAQVPSGWATFVLVLVGAS